MKAYKTWYYKNGINFCPVPVIVLGEWIFNSFNVIRFREVGEDGNLLPVQELICKNFDDFGLNEFAKFPEVKVNFCKNCGYIE